MERVFGWASRAMYMIAALVLAFFALGFVGVAVLRMVQGAFALDPAMATRALLDGTGFIVLAIAVFEIAKYLVEEEIIRERELRRADEVRRTLTRFLSTVIIAVTLEGLVLIFQAREGDMANVVFPALLLSVSVLMVVGLGLFQWVSRRAETIDPKQGGA